MIYAIGDIHGMRVELEKLVGSLPLAEDDHLIFIGDYVDRGPDPCGAVSFLIELEQSHRCTFLIGNHEAMFLSYLGWDTPWHFGGEAFLKNGGDTTLLSYGYYDAEDFQLPEAHEQFYRNLQPYWVEGSYAFVHAGLSRRSLQLSDIHYALSKERPATSAFYALP